MSIPPSTYPLERVNDRSLQADLPPKVRSLQLICVPKGSPCWHSLTHTQHPLACKWRKKMRGRRTQEEHTKWSCLRLWAAAALLFTDTPVKMRIYKVMCYSVLQSLPLLATAAMLPTAPTTICYSHLPPKSRTRHGTTGAGAPSTIQTLMTSKSKGNYLTVSKHTLCWLMFNWLPLLLRIWWS